MVKIINSSNETLAILQNVTNPIISEDINREFTFSFSTIIDNDKSSYVNYQNKVEVEDNYFNIVYTEEERTQDGIFINAQCEHVSYDLISANFTAGFTATGLFSAVATTLLSGTGFTVGINEITASQTISVNESTNARQILMQLASLYGGELKFDKYSVSLYTQRGANRGAQFRYRKNLAGVKRIVDNRKKVTGLPTISYQCLVAELEFEQDFIADGISNLEHHELGDTIKVIDADLGLSVDLRIVKESHDPEQRMQGTVEISNFVDDLTDTITKIQTTSVAKDNVYNGCSIGPDYGFVAERSDGKAKSIMNATEGISIYGDTGTGLTKNFYVDTAGRIQAAEIDISGTSTFKGDLSGASGTFTGNMTIGTGNNVFKADPNGIYLGNSVFASAPFRVNMAGSLIATAATITGAIESGSTITGSAFSGGSIAIGSSNNIFKADSNGIYLGNAVFGSAPFRVAMSGAVTATNLDLTGGSITISSDATVGNQLDIGYQTASETKSINFYNNAGNISNIELLNTGIMSIFNWNEIQITTTDLLTIDANGSASITCDGLDIYTYSGGDINLKPTNGDINLIPQSSGSVNIDGYVSFFGATPVTQQAVTSLPASASLTNCINTINGILTRLGDSSGLGFWTVSAP